MEAARSIHEDQVWLKRVYDVYVRIPDHFRLSDVGMEIDLEELARLVGDLTQGASFNTRKVLLEEYEILFPETRGVRVDLAARQDGILGNVEFVTSSLWAAFVAEAAPDGGIRRQDGRSYDCPT